MPARIARSSVQTAAPNHGRSKNRKRNLDAYAIASHQVTEKNRVKASRLGEVVDDGPRHKRRRTDDDEDDDEGSEEDEAPARGSKRQRALGGDDDIEQGSDSEGNEWTLGGLADDDDDSDLDSDEAFGESDEEKFEGFSFRGSSSGKRPPKKKPQQRNHKDDEDIDLDEQASEDSDENDDDGFGDEGVDLATMLDNDEDDAVEDAEGDSDERSGSDDEDEESEGFSSGDDDSDGDDDGADEERVARLRDRLEDMDKSSVAPKPKAAKASAISVEDLLADLDPSARKQFTAAIKTKKKSEAPKTLAAPLPKRQQDRMDREVASQKAKEQLDRWRDTVIHNRRAEFLSFPLKDPNGGVTLGTNKFSSDDKPRNELEENMRKIMEESGMASTLDDSNQPSGEDALMMAEELATNKLPVEEVMRRRAELRKARDLLFREEIKAKRIAKIKSKSYRRVHRRERERQSQLEREAREAAGLDGMEEDEKERADRQRAEERMSTKHRDSKWAKTLKATNRTAWDEGARDSVIEQARRNEELRRRIAGEGVEDGEGSDISSEDDEDVVRNGEGEEAVMLRRLGRLREQRDSEHEGKGLQNMKFMRAADERRRAQNNEDIERLRKELAVQDGDENDSDDEIHDQGLGRAVFGPQSKANQETAKKPKRAEMEEGDASDEEERADEDATIVTEKEASSAYAPKSMSQKRLSASGPLAKGRLSGKHSQKQGSSSVVGNAWLEAATGPTDTDKEGSWLAARTKSKKEQQRARASNDVAALDLNMTDTKPPSKPKRSGVTPAQTDEPGSRDAASAGNTDGWTRVTHPNGNDAGDDSDAESSSSLPEAQALQSKQSSYHARAFAGDDVEIAFQAEKDEAIASEDEKEISNHLPGWGSWTGEGLSKSVRKSNARQRHNPLWKQKLAGVKPTDRQDARLEKVIISEKKEAKGAGKKNGKYLTTILPHGFEKKEQYERSLRVPVGPEWTTKETFSRSTRPRVVVKPGTVIAAMEKPLM